MENHKNKVNAWFRILVSPYGTASIGGSPSLFELLPPVRSSCNLRILHPRDFIFECLVSQAIQIFCHAEDPIAEAQS